MKILNPEDNEPYQHDPQYLPSIRLKNASFLGKKDRLAETQSIIEQTLKWTDEQNQKYALFLKKNKRIFLSDKKRKCYGIFFKMSLFIKSRSKNQCKSHHQKMMKNKSIEQVIDNKSGEKKNVEILNGFKQIQNQITRKNEQKFSSNELLPIKLKKTNTFQVFSLSSQAFHPIISQGGINQANISIDSQDENEIFNVLSF